MDKWQVPVKYIQDHYYPDDRIAVVLIDRSTEAIEHEFRTARQVTGEKYQAHLRGANADGKDVYLTVNTLVDGAHRRTKADIDEIRHVYMDIDTGGKEAVDKILAAPEMPKPHSVLETSRGKHQLLWKVEGFEKQQVESLVRDLAAKHAADQAVWDCARVLRIPGFRNCKYEQAHYVKVQPGGADPDRIYKPADFPKYEIARESPQFGQRPESNRKVPGNSQSESDWAYAMRRLENGDSPSIIQQKIADFRRHDKPHPDRYAERTVLKARRELVSRAMGSTMSTYRESPGMSR